MFSHDAEPPKIMELCKFYLFERCAKKEKCLYLHKGFPCKYFHTGKRCLDSDESCKFSHGHLTDETRAILIKHLESAPKEILGDFPRMSREQAVRTVAIVEAKNRGWDEPVFHEPIPAPQGPGAGGGLGGLGDLAAAGGGRGGGRFGAPPGPRPGGPGLAGPRPPGFGQLGGFGRGGGGFGNNGPPPPLGGFGSGGGNSNPDFGVPPPGPFGAPPPGFGDGGFGEGEKKPFGGKEEPDQSAKDGSKGERRRKSRWHDEGDQGPSPALAAAAAAAAAVVAAARKASSAGGPPTSLLPRPPLPPVAAAAAPHVPVAVAPPVPLSAGGPRLLPAPAVANLEAFRGGIEQTKLDIQQHSKSPRDEKEKEENRDRRDSRDTPERMRRRRTFSNEEEEDRHSSSRSERRRSSSKSPGRRSMDQEQDQSPSGEGEYLNCRWLSFQLLAVFTLVAADFFACYCFYFLLLLPPNIFNLYSSPRVLEPRRSQPSRHDAETVREDQAAGGEEEPQLGGALPVRPKASNGLVLFGRGGG